MLANADWDLHTNSHMKLINNTEILAADIAFWETGATWRVSRTRQLPWQVTGVWAS